MSEILTRTITGAILVAVVIIATSYNLYTSIGLWLMLTILGVIELKSNTMGGKLGVIYLLIASLSVVCLGFFAIWLARPSSQKLFGSEGAPGTLPAKSYSGILFGLQGGVLDSWGARRGHRAEPNTPPYEPNHILG